MEPEFSLLLEIDIRFSAGGYFRLLVQLDVLASCATGCFSRNGVYLRANM